MRYWVDNKLVFEYVDPKPLTGKHVATALTVFRREPVTYQQVPLEQVRAMSEDMAAMYEWFEKVG